MARTSHSAQKCASGVVPRVVQHAIMKKKKAERKLKKLTDTNTMRKARQAKKDQKVRDKVSVKEEQKKRKRDEKKQRAEALLEHVTKSRNYFGVPMDS